MVGRLGGDEFAVILAQASTDAAALKAQHLQRQVEAEPLIHDGHAIPLRITFGVRGFEPGMDAVRMMAEADAAMFLQKGVRGSG